MTSMLDYTFLLHVFFLEVNLFKHDSLTTWFFTLLSLLSIFNYVFMPCPLYLKVNYPILFYCILICYESANFMILHLFSKMMMMMTMVAFSPNFFDPISQLLNPNLIDMVRQQSNATSHYEWGFMKKKVPL